MQSELIVKIIPDTTDRTDALRARNFIRTMAEVLEKSGNEEAIEDAKALREVDLIIKRMCNKYMPEVFE